MSDDSGMLLVGGSGFFGSALAKALANGGHRVHVLSRECEEGESDGIEWHAGDQEDPDAVLPLLDHCDTVVHLASTSTPGSSARTPLLEAEGNLLPIAQFIETASSRPPQRLIYVSSGGAIYGDVVEQPVKEASRPAPRSYHAAGKVAAEAFLTAFSHANEVPLTILRPANLYGPHQPLRAGFGVVRTLFDKAMHDEEIEIWGDGSAVRDYLYIDDAVEACLALIEQADATGVFNVGSGIGTSLDRLVSLIGDVVGHPLNVMRRPVRKTDVHAIHLDCASIREATGWTATTPLQEGLRATWDALQDSG